ncbi:hypothetical protein GCM10010145_48440 [Streptomyces ruber]|uniref:Uncharacterized protein n=2 Tax=Streptomyces TaxID=1883 RepID=A0A918EWP7_9ACTN|nr:hypothetical protein [Streptomyces ruber]GGQ73031.1 hypothetical protein GCM10010145_48440 [Streptomyces ruber]
MPGSEFVQKVRDHGRKVTHYIAQVPDGAGEPRVNPHALAAALETKYDEGRLFVTVDGGQVLICLWDTSPLAQVFPATREIGGPGHVPGVDQVLAAPDVEGVCSLIPGSLANSATFRPTRRDRVHAAVVGVASGEAAMEARTAAPRVSWWAAVIRVDAAVGSGDGVGL